MASGTIYGSTGNQYIDSKIVWSATANTSANTSSVTASLYYKRNNTGFTTQGTGSFTITIDGQAATASKYMTITENAWVLAVTATKTVNHNGDGTKAITISASGSIPDTTLSSTSCSGRVSLDTIARASTLTSASNKTLGSACSVKWTPLSKSFRYKLKFSLGSWSYTTAAIHPNTTSAYTYTGYTLPLTVANQLPSAKTGTMTVVLYTYSDSGASTQVGSTSSKTFTVTVPDNSSTKPTVSMTLTPVSSLGTTFSSLYIQGKSKVKAVISGSGKYGATISSYKMYAQGKSYSSPYQSGYLSTPGTVTVKGIAYDSRDYYDEIETDITVLPYSKPALLPASGESSIICARSDVNGNLSESGTYLKIKARRSYSKVTSDGTQKNFCIIRYRVREETTNTFSSWVTILAKTATSDVIDVTLSNVVSSAETAYFVQIGVVDDIGESAAVQFSIPSDFVTIDVPEKHKGKRVGVGRYAEDSDEPGIDVGMPIHGGSVDNLTLGDLITATSSAPIDLNNYKTAGNYYSPNADNSKYITNSPYTDGGFSLIVRHLQSANMIRQELFYGRSNWQRHYNSSTDTWSDWLRYLMTDEPTSTAVDFVTEIGVHTIDANSYWRYRKWKSGAVDLNGVFKVTPELDSTFSSIVRYSKQIQIPLPFKVETFQFVGTPATSYYLLTNATINTDSDGNNSVAFRLLRFIDFAGDSTSIRIIASGKIK